MKCLIVEPHADDAIYSCYPVLLNANKKKIVLDTLTVSADGDRKPENIRRRFLVGQTFDFLLTDYYNYLELPAEAARDHAEAFKYYRTNYEHYVTLQQKMSAFCFASYDKIYCPFGLVHPMHVVVRQAVDEVVDPTKVIYYLEQPYLQLETGKRWQSQMLKAARHLSRYAVNTKSIRSDIVEIYGAGHAGVVDEYPYKYNYLVKGYHK
ncbi:MAG: hypothetical protein WCV63_01980 [Negativicutes bacterium]|jgi:hypothetical protein